jgi:hypothetical protein
VIIKISLNAFKNKKNTHTHDTNSKAKISTDYKNKNATQLGNDFYFFVLFFSPHGVLAEFLKLVKLEYYCFCFFFLLKQFT